MASRHGKGWRARWLDENDRRHSRTFKYQRDAVAYERQQKALVEQIRRGLVAPASVDHTIDELADYWIEYRASRKRSGDHDESIIRAHLRELGHLKLRGSGPTLVAYVDQFVTSRSHLHPKTINNILTLLIAMLHVAVDLGWLDKVPRIRKPSVRAFSRDFSYLRTDEEVRRFLRAALDEGEMVFVLYACAVFTGMRAGELAGLWWDDVSIERRLITVQRSYDGPTKAEDVRYVPILDALLPILREWRLRHPGRLVFTNQSGRMLGKSARVFQEILHRVLDAADFPMVERRGKLRRYITFHDTRHTFASQWMMKGGDIFKLQKILGHKTVQMTMRYAHLAPHAFAEDWGRFSDTGVGQVADVIELPAAQSSMTH